MNITLSIDEQIAERAREKLRAVGKSLNQEIREHLAHIAGDDDEQLERVPGGDAGGGGGRERHQRNGDHPGFGGGLAGRERRGDRTGR